MTAASISDECPIPDARPSYDVVPVPGNAICAHPRNPGELFATLEVGGAMRSRDGGESWSDCTETWCDWPVSLDEEPHPQ